LRGFIAARPILALRVKKEINDWRDAINQQLGYLADGQLPELVRRELSQEQITVR
jgi:hypothetical protein